MTTDLDNPPRCPRCGSHDLAVVSIANEPLATRITLTCDACGTHHEHLQHTDERTCA